MLDERNNAAARERSATIRTAENDSKSPSIEHDEEDDGQDDEIEGTVDRRNMRNTRQMRRKQRRAVSPASAKHLRTHLTPTAPRESLARNHQGRRTSVSSRNGVVVEADEGVVETRLPTAVTSR